MKEQSRSQVLREANGLLCRLDKLCSIWFIAALGLLLLNDYYWKAAYHNWFTGKISDFAGLFVLSVFLIVLWPERKVSIAWAIGVIFFVWKSSISQPAVDLWNALPLMTVGRTIDYTDLIAITVLPVAVFYRPTFQLPRLAGFVPLVIIAITLVGIMGTSRAVRQSYLPTTPPQYLIDEPPESLVQRIENVFVARGNVRIADQARIDQGPPPPAPVGKYDTSYYEQFSHMQFRDRDSKQFDVRFVLLPDASRQRTVIVLHGVTEFGSGKGQDDLRALFEDYVIAKLKSDTH
jgi:hypothetical protein